MEEDALQKNIIFTGMLFARGSGFAKKMCGAKAKV